MSDETIEKVRALHAPSKDARWWHAECEGCDFIANSEGEPPEWPCRTADLVYSADEIALAEWVWAEQRHAYRLAHPPDPNAKPLWQALAESIAGSIDRSIFIPINRDSA